MSSTLSRSLQCVRNTLVITVFVTCTMLLAVGWPKKSEAPKPYLRPRCRVLEYGNRVSQLEPDTVHSCNVSNLKVLGKTVDRCATLRAMRVAEEEDIYVSVKTVSVNHVSRMLPVLLTWLQTLQPKQIHIITDVISKDEPLYQIASKAGMDVLATGCGIGHTGESLCCKSSIEYWQYLNTTKESGELYKWYCHFDDDVYVNIPVLVAALRETLCKLHDGGVYFGRWPVEMLSYKLRRGWRITRRRLNLLGFDFLKHDLYTRWATGAAYCVSSTVMRKMRDILRKLTFEEYCAIFGASDDVTAAILIGIAGYAVFDDKRVKTHYDPLKDFSVSELRNMITISYKNTRVVEIPDSIFSLKEDPTRFLSYHCLLYPSTTWCRKST